MMKRSEPTINQLFFTFLGKLVFSIVFIGLMYLAVINLFPDMTVPSKTIPIFIVLFSVTAGVHFILLKAMGGDPSRFANFIIFSVVIKLFLYAIFTFLLIISDRRGAMANIILFFVVYIALTVFEITTMYHQINRTNNR